LAIAKCAACGATVRVAGCGTVNAGESFAENCKEQRVSRKRPEDCSTLRKAIDASQRRAQREGAIAGA
jgi:hypothetical protein